MTPAREIARCNVSATTPSVSRVPFAQMPRGSSIQELAVGAGREKVGGPDGREGAAVGPRGSAGAGGGAGIASESAIDGGDGAAALGKSSSGGGGASAFPQPARSVTLTAIIRTVVEWARRTAPGQLRRDAASCGRDTSQLLDTSGRSSCASEVDLWRQDGGERLFGNGNGEMGAEQLTTPDDVPAWLRIRIWVACEPSPR